MSEPLVSVVTPFHNTANYLRECIESVLKQTYTHFEYILVDNCSTDGSGDIAQQYARQDSRIRFFSQPALLAQVPNYNSALSKISSDSKYCKLVQADDFLFSDCLSLMVTAFEQSESIGLAGAYDLKGGVVRGSGVPCQSLPFSGKEIARLYLRKSVFPFGSPTTVMYRSSLVRSHSPFYAEGLLHEDTEKCMQILQSWDFVFVHQVLSFLRSDNESISSAARNFQPEKLDRYIVVNRYAKTFLDFQEAAALARCAKSDYYLFLAEEALRLREPAFWNYQRCGLRTLNQELDRSYLALKVLQELFRLATNPGSTIARLVRRLKKGRVPGAKTSPSTLDPGQEELAQVHRSAGPGTVSSGEAGNR